MKQLNFPKLSASLLTLVLICTLVIFSYNKPITKVKAEITNIPLQSTMNPYGIMSVNGERNASGLPGFFVQPGLTPEETRLVGIIQNLETKLRRENPGITILVGNNNPENRSFINENININPNDLDPLLRSVRVGDAVNSRDLAFGAKPASDFIFFNTGNLVNSIKIINPNSPETYILGTAVNEFFDLLMIEQNLADRNSSQSLSYVITTWLQGGIREISIEEFINLYKESLRSYPASTGYLKNPAKTVELLNKAIQVIFGVDVGLVANGAVIIPTKFIRGFGSSSQPNYRGTDNQDNVILHGGASDINTLRQSDIVVVASDTPVVNVILAKGLDTAYAFPQENQIINGDGGQGIDILNILAPNGVTSYTINAKNFEQINITGGVGTINRS